MQPGTAVNSDAQAPPAFSPASLRSAAGLPNQRLVSSVDAGWTSVLLERQGGAGESPRFDTGITPDHTIVVALRGEHELEVLAQGRWQRATYRPGTAGMTPGGESATLQWRARGTGSVETAHLYLPQHFIHAAADHYRRAGQDVGGLDLCALAFTDATVAQTVHALLRGVEHGAPDLYAQSAALWLATHLLSVQGTLRLHEDRRFPGALTDRRLARVMEFMTAHFHRPLTIEQLAAEAALSKFHFVRLFSRKAGCTPHEFLVRVRMDAARRMLAATDASIADIARACGYANTSNFGVAFARRNGVTPSKFRRGTLAR